MTAGTVTLTWDEYVGCVNVGLLRWGMSMAAGHTPYAGAPRDWTKGVGINVLGACGERAYAKWVGGYWGGSVNTFHGVPDLGGRTEVRTTELDDGCLIVRPNDDPSRSFVLITGTPPTFTVRGWITGNDARQERYRRGPNDRPPAWFVPQAALRFTAS